MIGLQGLVRRHDNARIALARTKAEAEAGAEFRLACAKVLAETKGSMQNRTYEARKEWEGACRIAAIAAEDVEAAEISLQEARRRLARFEIEQAVVETP